MISGKPDGTAIVQAVLAQMLCMDGGFYKQSGGGSSNVVIAVYYPFIHGLAPGHNLAITLTNRRLNSISKICYCEVRILLITFIVVGFLSFVQFSESDQDLPTSQGKHTTVIELGFSHQLTTFYAAENSNRHHVNSKRGLVLIPGDRRLLLRNIFHCDPTERCASHVSL